jgi:hypothetical protein
MLWASVRQFRAQAIVAAAALGALAVLIVLVGLHVWDDFDHNVASCAHSTDCAAASTNFVNTFSEMWTWLNGLMLVVPGLVGVFWGAPLVARELETGTFRLAWTQSISRARWTIVKLGLLGLAAMVVAGLCSLLVTWWSSPLDFAGAAGPFANFDARDIAPIGYAAFAFTLGVAAGAVLRRTVAAMGVTLVVFAGVRVAFVEWVRPHLMAPFVTRTPFSVTTPRRVQIGAQLPHGAWVISSWLVTRAGQVVGGGVNGLFANVSAGPGGRGISIPGVGSCPGVQLTPAVGQKGIRLAGGVAQCVNQLHLSYLVTYQPASRYWPFQLYETLIFFGLAAVIGACTVWWVRRIN